jgi:hypothetical protein
MSGVQLRRRLFIAGDMIVAIRGLGPMQGGCSTGSKLTGPLLALSLARTLLGGPEFESPPTTFHQDIMVRVQNSSAALLYSFPNI